MNNDFRKYATGHLGMSGMVLDDVMKAQAQYMNPYILEERPLKAKQIEEIKHKLLHDQSFCII